MAQEPVGPVSAQTHSMTTTLHILWGRDAVGRYRMGIMDNIVRIAHSAYEFNTEQEAQAFLLGINESRQPDDWLQVTSLLDTKKLGTPVRMRLIEAAKNGDLDAVRALVEAGMSTEVKDEKGLSPLHWAAKNGHAEVAEALLEAGADVDVKAQNGTSQTPLHMACTSAAFGTPQVVDVLIQRGANAEQQDHRGNRALHSLVGGQDGNEASVGAKMRSVIDGGADPRSENNQGQKPLNSPVGAAAGSAALLAAMMHMLNNAEEMLEAREARRAHNIKAMSGMTPWQQPRPQ